MNLRGFGVFILFITCCAGCSRISPAHIMTKSTKSPAVNAAATKGHAALAAELSQLALQATYLNQRSASLPNTYTYTNR